MPRWRCITARRSLRRAPTSPASEPSRRHRFEPDGERESRGSWILARLRNRRFFSLPELNAAIRRLVDELNMRVMRGYGASRADLFTTLDRPQLQPLPPQPYEFARWKRARVGVSAVWGAAAGC